MELNQADVERGAQGFSTVFIATFMLIAVIAGMSLWSHRKQRDYREVWARSRGFGFSRSDRELGSALERILSLPGSGHMALDIVVMPILDGICLYGRVRWSEGTGDDRRAVYRSFVRYDLRAPLPNLRLVSNGFLSPVAVDGAAPASATRDADDEKFDASRQDSGWQWDVQTDDYAFAHELLSPGMRAFVRDRMRGMELVVSGKEAYLGLGPRYDHRESTGYRDLMIEWEDEVVPFLWEQKSF